MILRGFKGVFLDEKQPSDVFCEKGALRNFAKFTRKHLCQSLFFNKVAGLRPDVSCEFCEIPKNTFITEHLRAAASICEKERYKIQLN